MSSREFSEWLIYDRLEPFGDLRRDWQTALLRSDLYNINRDRDKHPEPFEPNQFLLRFDAAEEPEEKESEESMSPHKIYSRFKTWAMLAGAKVNNGNTGQTDRSAGA